MTHKHKDFCSTKEFYGTTTVGERGQVVIPADARRTLKIEQGDKMLVFGIGEVVACVKFNNLEKVASEMAAKLAEIQEIIKETK